MVENRNTGVLTFFTTFHDLSVSRNPFSKDEMRQFSEVRANVYNTVGNRRVRVSRWTVESIGQLCPIVHLGTFRPQNIYIDICFRASSATLGITNPTEGIVAFKIKTTAPKRFVSK